MSARVAFRPVKENGWALGLRNLLRKENRAWWRTRRWWTQTLIWLFGVNGLVAFVLFVLPTMVRTVRGGLPEGFDLVAAGAQSFFQIGAMAMALGVVVLTQGTVQDEVQSGTAAWVFSKPASRAAFLLSKLMANAIGVLTVMVGLQSAVAYVLFSLQAGTPLPLGSFGMAALGLALHTLFYLSLTLLLGVVCQSRGTVLGGALGCLLGGSVVAALVPPLAMLPPWSLSGLMLGLVLGQVLPTANLVLASMLATATVSLAFVLLAIRRFERAEF